MRKPNNMTMAQVLERHRQRQSILNSAIAAEYRQFSVADAVRHLSDYRQDGEVVTESAAKTLLDKMVDEDLLIKTRIASKTRYSIPKPNFITVDWGVKDNGVRLGMHQPPQPTYSAMKDGE